VYRYFRSKVDIIQAMCERAYLDDVQVMNDSMRDRDTLDIFEELIRVFFLEMETSRSTEVCALIAELASEAQRTPEVRERFASQEEFLARLVPGIADWNSERVRQFQTLTHPDHLGRAFKVLVQSR
jgi:AcrR family transcriptional regulator